MGNVIPYFQLQLLTFSIKTVRDMPEDGDCVSDHVQAVKNSCLWLVHSYLFILSGCAEMGWHPMKERALPTPAVSSLPSWFSLLCFPTASHQPGWSTGIKHMGPKLETSCLLMHPWAMGPPGFFSPDYSTLIYLIHWDHVLFLQEQLLCWSKQD